MVNSLAYLATLLSPVLAGTIVWDGRFNDLSSNADLNKWSWGNQVGPYQYYIHGSGTIDKYVNLASSYKNPADSGSKQGVKITIDNTAFWNGQNMRRTELIPQSTQSQIASGKLFYHFSMKRTNTNAPSTATEHQVNFFESHFTEMKYGLISGASGTSDSNLRWFVGGQSKWNVVFDADVWHNVAYEIDFSGNKVGFWHSTGSDALKQVIAPIAASTSSNGQDWHLGVLRLPGNTNPSDPAAEDWYFSGVYVESGSITTSVTGSGGSTGGGDTTTPVSSSTPTKTSTTPSTTYSTLSTSKVASSSTSAAASPSASSAGTLAKYAQCGGKDWTGSGTCVSGATCKVVNDFYSQCL